MFRIKGRIFHESEESVSAAASERGFFYMPSPTKGEVGELLWKGMMPGGNPIVGVFWWLRAAANQWFPMGQRG